MDKDDNDQLSQSESLKIIEDMIQQAKSQFNEDGHLYLFWGWLIFTCSIGFFVLSHIFHAPWSSLVWMLTWVAMVYNYFYLRRKHGRRKVTTYADRFLGIVWMSYLIALVVMVLIVGSIYVQLGMNYYVFNGPVLLCMYGIPTFTTGKVLNFKPLFWGAIGCWTLAVIYPFVPYDYNILLLAVAMLIAWIIPGYILKNRHKKSNTPASDHGLQGT
jgi:hypothetical protein